MSPAVHRNACDVASGIKPCLSQHEAQLLANVPFKGRVGSLDEFGAPGTILVTDRQSRLARCTNMKHGRFIGLAGEFVFPDADRIRDV